MYIQNAQNKVVQGIEAEGESYGLPLFGGSAEVEIIDSEKSIPLWLWSGNGIKVEIYRKMESVFAKESLEYLSALITLGGSATDHEVKSYLNDESRWPLHIVSARRNYFVKSPYYLITSYPDKKKLGPKRVLNTIWFIDFKKLNLILETTNQR